MILFYICSHVFNKLSTEKDKIHLKVDDKKTEIKSIQSQKSPKSEEPRKNNQVQNKINLDDEKITKIL